MVSFNVYRSTYSGAYVEGICLATDEKPVVGIANGSILYAVDASNGETTRYMYDKESMSWIEAECPCSGGGSGGSGGSGGDIMLVNGVYDSGRNGVKAIDKSWNELKAAYDAGKLCLLKYEFIYTPSGGAATNVYSLEPLAHLGATAANYTAAFGDHQTELESDDPDTPMGSDGDDHNPGRL